MFRESRKNLPPSETVVDFHCLLMMFLITTARMTTKSTTMTNTTITTTKNTTEGGFPRLLADPGEARGCSTNTFVINSFINSVSQPFPPTALRRRHAQTVRDSSSSYKIDYVIVIKTYLNPEGHQNRISGSKVTAILLKGWVLPIGGTSALEGCNQRGYPV